MTPLGALPFLVVVVIVLPGLAAVTGRRLRLVEPGGISPRAVYLQTVLTQAVIAALGLVALRATGHTVELFGRITLAGVTVAVALVVVALALASRLRRLAKDAEKVAALLRPRSALDRMLWVGSLGVVAVVEEFAYRGVLFVLLRDLSGSGAAAAVGSAAAFGLAHLAQGWIGALLSGLFALGFQAVAILNQGLGLAIAAHFVYDRLAARQNGRTEA